MSLVYTAVTSSADNKPCLKNVSLSQQLHQKLTDINDFNKQNPKYKQIYRHANHNKPQGKETRGFNNNNNNIICQRQLSYVSSVKGWVILNANFR